MINPFPSDWKPKCRKSTMSPSLKNSDSDSSSEDSSSEDSKNESSDDSDTENFKKPEQKKPDILKLLIFICVTVIALVCLWPNTPKSDEKINTSYLRSHFESQPNETWEIIEVIINDVLLTPPIHPAIFLFLYVSDKNKTDELIDSVAKFALNKINIAEDYITVQEEEFTNSKIMADYGHLISTYQPILSKRRVMVIKDLHKMPAKVAQALHFFCDEFSPLVDGAIYIFSLKVNSLEGKEMCLAEKTLKKEWSDLDEDILMPLITRVTSTVLKIF